MYMDYSNLWKLLIDKGITKTELMELTGLSSRILAKLSKNETVTTETLAKICSALNCNVSEIMECKKDSEMSVYNHYRKFGTVTEETDTYKKVCFTFNAFSYTVYAIKRSSAKANLIHCRADGTIYRERLYPFGGTMSPSSVTSGIIKPVRNGEETVIVLFPGKPRFTGLDEGIFVSWKRPLPSKNAIYVMSEASFKLYTPLH